MGILGAFENKNKSEIISQSPNIPSPAHASSINEAFWKRKEPDSQSAGSLSSVSRNGRESFWAISLYIYKVLL